MFCELFKVNIKNQKKMGKLQNKKNNDANAIINQIRYWKK